MKNTLPTGSLNILTFAFIFLFLLASCASNSQLMTKAALNGDSTALSSLLQRNPADVNTFALVDASQSKCPGETILTPLQAAACAGRARIVKQLLESEANPDLPTSKGTAPLFLALNNSREDVVRLLVEAGAKLDVTDREGNTALMVATKQGNLSLTEFLLKNGASLQHKNLQGETALMLAPDVRLAQTLVSAGANLSAKNNNGDTALQIATRNGNADTARFFEDFEGKLRQGIETDLAQGDRAAETDQPGEALTHYANAISKAMDIGGSTEKDALTRVIQTVNGWPNPPALSDKGREHLVRSSYILKKSQDFQQAEKEMAAVLRTDPWWLDGYYNLGILQSNIAKFDEAEHNLALYIAASPDTPKSRAAQDKIYELRIAKEETEKLNGIKGTWVDDQGAHYEVGVDGSNLRIVSRTGLVFSLTINNNTIQGSVEGKAMPGPHRCTLPGQIHPVNGKLDSDAKGMSIEYLWSNYDTRFHCVNMFGVPTVNCCLTCDEVCDAVNIVATNTIRRRLVRSR